MVHRLKAMLAVLALWGLLEPGVQPASAQDSAPQAGNDSDEPAPPVRRRRAPAADRYDAPRTARGEYEEETPPRAYRYARTNNTRTRRPYSVASRTGNSRTASYQDSPETLPAPPPVPPGPGRSPQTRMPPATQGAPAPIYDSFDDSPTGPPGYDGHDGQFDGYDDGHFNGYFDGAPGCDGPCGAPYAGPCCGPVYVRAEYIAWAIKGDSLPPLVTTSPSGTARTAAGVLGQTGTTELFGGDTVNNQLRSGGRIALGWWLDPTARIEGEFFALGQQQAQFSESSSGTPILARPFFNAQTGAQDSNVIAYPGQVSGSVRAAAISGSFLGAGLHATQNMRFIDFGCDRQTRIDFLYGLRYLHLQEGVQVISSSTATSGVAAGTNLIVTDNFRTTNNFYGIDLGLSTDHRAGRWCLTTIGRFGLGGTTEHININGNTVTTPTGGTATTTAGGLLTQPTNIGTHSHSGFTVVPQLELKLGYDLTPQWRATVGYDIIYWSRVARPGDQISTVVNTSQAGGGTLSGAPVPQFNLRETDLWVQGISAGLEYRF